MNQDSSVLILVERYEVYKNKHAAFSRYTYDEHTPIFYDVPTYSSEALPPFLPAQKLEQSNADRLGQFVHKCKLVNSEYTQVIAQQYLKFNQGYLKVYYLAKAHVNNLAEIVDSHNDFIRFDDRLQVNVDVEDVKRYFVNIDKRLAKNLLNKAWNRGGLYHGLWYFTGEKYAFQLDSVIVSLQFPSNKVWPYFNYITFSEQRWSNSDHWEKANKDYTKYLINSKGKYKKISKSDLRKLNADEGYWFDFSHHLDDLYRNDYQDCKVYLIHKKNVGSILIKYYFKPKDRHKLNELIKNTLGQIAFYDESLLDQLGNTAYPY